MIELSVIVDAGKLFVRACYDLEGDGPLAPVCYAILSSVRTSVQVKHWPNIHAFARRLALEVQNPALEQQLLDHAHACVQPAFMYFENKFWSEPLLLVNAFKAAHLFDPSKVIYLHPYATTIEDFKSFHLFRAAYS